MRTRHPATRLPKPSFNISINPPPSSLPSYSNNNDNQGNRSLEGGSFIFAHNFTPSPSPPPHLSYYASSSPYGQKAPFMANVCGLKWEMVLRGQVLWNASSFLASQLPSTTSSFPTSHSRRIPLEDYWKEEKSMSRAVVSQVGDVPLKRFQSILASLQIINSSYAKMNSFKKRIANGIGTGTGSGGGGVASSSYAAAASLDFLLPSLPSSTSEAQSLLYAIFNIYHQLRVIYSDGFLL